MCTCCNDEECSEKCANCLRGTYSTHKGVTATMGVTSLLAGGVVDGGLSYLLNASEDVWNEILASAAGVTAVAMLISSLLEYKKYQYDKDNNKQVPTSMFVKRLLCRELLAGSVCFGFSILTGWVTEKYIYPSSRLHNNIDQNVTDAVITAMTASGIKALFKGMGYLAAQKSPKLFFFCSNNERGKDEDLPLVGVKGQIKL